MALTSENKSCESSEISRPEEASGTASCRLAPSSDATTTRRPPTVTRILSDAERDAAGYVLDWLAGRGAE